MEPALRATVAATHDGDGAADKHKIDVAAVHAAGLGKWACLVFGDVPVLVVVLF